MLGNITEYEVCRIVEKMKAKFSCGIDGLSNNFVKKIISSINVPLSIVLNKSLNEGIFPNAMKVAKVCALYKNGNLFVKDNYRPISLLPVFSKILERHVYL